MNLVQGIIEDQREAEEKLKGVGFIVHKSDDGTYSTWGPLISPFEDLGAYRDDGIHNPRFHLFPADKRDISKGQICHACFLNGAGLERLF